MLAASVVWSGSVNTSPAPSKKDEPVSREQNRYQIRFDWGLDGVAAVGADVDVLVWVDAVVTDAGFDPDIVESPGEIIAGDFASAGAVAQWIVDRQNQLAKRVTIAVIGAGAGRTGGYRFAVEDLLAAGAVIRSLGELGLDATSPEAAAAEAAYLGLGRGLAHLVSASVSVAEGASAPIATRVDPNLGASDVRVLRSGR
jgi:hypothetical protein